MIMLRKLLDYLKRRLPVFFGQVFSLRDAVKVIPARIRLSSLRKSGLGLSVVYLGGNFPNPPACRTEYSQGGAVKLTYLAEALPHHFPQANLLYAVSSVAHPLQKEILESAKKKGLKIVVNQNGVAFPAWAGEKYTTYNKDLKNILDHSDYIIYQSRFCRVGAQRYLVPPDVPSEVIFNPVDLGHFSLRDNIKKPKDLTLLLGGNQYQQYRLELAFQTLHSLLGFVPNAKLIITGNLWRPHVTQAWARHVMQEMGISDHVSFIGPYTQEAAPTIYSRAHLLLHTQYADASPGLVAEALACGLPVVHLSNGGVPELVEEAGIGVPVEHSWEKINLPDPHKMAEAVLKVYNDINDYSQAARQQAQKFALEKFVSRHKEIFSKILELNS